MILTLNMSVELSKSLVCLVSLLGFHARLSVNKGEDGGYDWTSLLWGSDLPTYKITKGEKCR